MSEQLRHFLGTHGLAACYEALAAESVDLDILPDLTDEDLARLGFSLGQRKRLLRAAITLAAPARPPESLLGERRRLTVMFCDLAGSTDVASRMDPEDFHAIVSAHLAVAAGEIERFRGFVARYLGDGLLAYFGWPRASDNDAERAASAALAVIAGMQQLAVTPRLKMRVGMATGLVVVGDMIGAGTAREVVVSGETANLAARLQSAAEPDGVLVSAETRALLGPAFVIGPARPLALKGFADPVPAYPVLAERNVAAPAPLETAPRLLAREADLAWLTKQVEEARAAGAGRVLLLRGEPGIGKTRLAQGFADALPAPTRVLRARALHRHANSSLYPVAALARDLAGLHPSDTPDDALGKLAAWLPASPPGHRALVAALLDLPADEAAMPPDPRDRKEALLATLVNAILNVARTAPLVLIVEDVHWADATTLDFLARLATGLAALPAVLLLVARPEFQPAWPGVDIRARLIGPLPENACAALAAAVAGKRLPPEVLAALLSRADGVPLFVEEVTRAALESGCLTDAGTEWRLARDLADLDIPATLHDSLLARLDRLGWVKELAQVGAVIGRDFDAALLGAVTRHDAHRLDSGLQQLIAAGLIAEGDTPGQYGFRHALVQDAAYRSLLHSLRRELHARVAAVFVERAPETARRQPEILAHHWTEARVFHEAAGCWRRAGERDLKRAANREAVVHFSRALETLARCPDGEARDFLELDIRRALGTAQIGVFGYTGETLQENTEKALAVSERLADPGRLLAPMAAHAGAMYSRGEMAQARRLSEQLVRVAERSGMRGQRMVAHRLLGMAMLGTGAFAAAEAELRASLALAKPARDAERLGTEPLERSAAALGYLSLVEHFLGRPDAARASDEAAMARAVALDHPGTLVHAATLRACLMVLGADDAGLAATATLLAEGAARQGSHPATVAAQSLGALAEASRTGASEAFARAAAGRAELRAIGWIVLFAWVTHKEADACLAHGHIAQAETVLNEQATILDPRGYDMFRPASLLQRAELALRRGDIAEAAARHTEAQSLARAQNALVWRPRAEAIGARLRAEATAEVVA